MAICPDCGGAMLTERPHRHPTDDRATLAAPTTEAGRRLLARLDGMMEALSADQTTRQRYHEDDLADILAIEADALALPPPVERLAKALRRIGLMEEPLPGTTIEQFAAAIRAAWETEKPCEHEFTMLSNPPTCAKCGKIAVSR